MNNPMIPMKATGKASAKASGKASGLALMLSWQRILLTFLASSLMTLLLSFVWQSGLPSLVARVLPVGLLTLLVFGIFEQWPKRMPAWFARWVLQVLGVALIIPLSLILIWVFSTETGAPPFWMERERLGGFAFLCIVGMFFAPWIALAALVRQKDAFARDQALIFDLERSELERNVQGAKLHLLQAQVAPHFLFNTLANVQALVQTGSPQAPMLLDSLIAYLRAAVPRLQETANTLSDELQLVRAYLDLMHMRMPDRLQFSLHVEADALTLKCPPMTLLTLVENAVKHGIDPSEVGGRIDIHAVVIAGRCRLQVRDTGVGFQASAQGLGTGLATLRARLKLEFSNDAQLHMSELVPHGVCAELEFPAQFLKRQSDVTKHATEQVASS